MVVTTRQLVHAALWPVVCFGALAGCYLVLTAEFVAWVQVLIYVGAVVVLLLFGIGAGRGRPSGGVTISTPAIGWWRGSSPSRRPEVLVSVVVGGFQHAYAELPPGAGSAETLGASIFRNWVLPFEALSVLLLAALIGAIVLSRTDIKGRG